MSYFDVSPPDSFLLTGHTDEESAYVVYNYPYGGQRTQIRYWIETVAIKGDRFVSQTLNPKTGRWNKPKKSTYTPIRFMNVERQEDGRDFIKADAALSLYTSTDDLAAWKEFVAEHGNSHQKTQYVFLAAVCQRRAT